MKLTKYKIKTQIKISSPVMDATLLKQFKKGLNENPLMLKVNN